MRPLHILPPQRQVRTQSADKKYPHILCYYPIILIKNESLPESTNLQR